MFNTAYFLIIIIGSVGVYIESETLQNIGLRSRRLRRASPVSPTGFLSGVFALSFDQIMGR